MTVKQARKVLGELAKNQSDADIERDIRTATILKDLFFAQLINRRLVAFND